MAGPEQVTEPPWARVKSGYYRASPLGVLRILWSIKSPVQYRVRVCYFPSYVSSPRFPPQECHQLPSCELSFLPLTLQSRSPAPILMVVFHGEGYFRWAWVEMDWYTDTWLDSTASLPPLMIPGFVIACS